MRSLVILVDGAAGARHADPCVLQRAGYRVAAVADADTALEAARRGTPRLVILEVSEGPRKPLRLARRLRSHPATAGVPIVVIAGALSATDIHRLGRVGRLQACVGPLSPAALLCEVQRATREPPAAGRPTG
jgi:PleD family two-component response regulator